MNTDQCEKSVKCIDEYARKCHPKAFSFMSIVVGAFIGIGLGFLLNLFSVAIGLSIVTTTHEGAVTLAVGGFIGLAIGTIVSMFVAGFASGYIARVYHVRCHLGVLYGFSTWCLALILGVLLASHMARYASMYESFISNPTATVIIDNKVNTAIETVSPVVAVATDNQTHQLGNIAFLTFILFFIGAISSCFGGHYGMECKKESCAANKPTVTTL